MARAGGPRALVVAVVALALAGCTSASSSTAGTPPSASTGTASPTAATGGTPAVVVRWVDGDTVETSLGRVRLIGMDTPERGRCGFGPASSRARSLAPVGSTVTLVAVEGRDDRDRYGRLLRYVDAGSVDVGEALVESGLARARYDSRDGYGAHPREREYIQADAAAPDVCP